MWIEGQGVAYVWGLRFNCRAWCASTDGLLWKRFVKDGRFRWSYDTIWAVPMMQLKRNRRKIHDNAVKIRGNLCGLGIND